MAESMVSQATFAKAVGVSRAAIGKAIQAGRLQPYNEAGLPVSATFRGRKFLKLEEAKEAFECNRIRLDNWFLDR
jgi:biotin operon repressor